MKQLNRIFGLFLIILALFSCSLLTNQANEPSITINVQDIATKVRDAGAEEFRIRIALVDNSIKDEDPLIKEEIITCKSESEISQTYTIKDAPFNKDLSIFILVEDKNQIPLYHGFEPSFTLTKENPIHKAKIVLFDQRTSDNEFYKVTWCDDVDKGITRTKAKVYVYAGEIQFPMVDAITRNGNEATTSFKYHFFTPGATYSIRIVQTTDDYQNEYTQTEFTYAPSQSDILEGNLSEIYTQGIENINCSGTSIGFNTQYNEPSVITNLKNVCKDTFFQGIVDVHYKKEDGNWDFLSWNVYSPANEDKEKIDLVDSTINLTETYANVIGGTTLTKSLASKGNSVDFTFAYSIGFKYQDTEYNLPLITKDTNNPKYVFTYSNGSVSLREN